jgi:hypothetical protein
MMTNNEDHPDGSITITLTSLFLHPRSEKMSEESTIDKIGRQWICTSEFYKKTRKNEVKKEMTQ